MLSIINDSISKAIAVSAIGACIISADSEFKPYTEEMS